MKKILLTLPALLLTAGLFFLVPKLFLPSRTTSRSAVRIIRVWNGEKDPALGGWLRKRAAAYEKETGVRVYLRSASREEIGAVQAGSESDLVPDLIIQSGKGVPIAMGGYALILKDAQAAVHTPSPTGALFHHPSPTPGPSPTPCPTPDLSALSAILGPEALNGTLPGVIVSSDPAGEMRSGRASAALLTAEQAASLPFGYQAFAIPGGQGVLPIGAEAMTENGNELLRDLLSVASQAQLAEFGLYSPRMPLYGSGDPLRCLIESGISFSGAAVP